MDIVKIRSLIGAGEIGNGDFLQRCSPRGVIEDGYGQFLFLRNPGQQLTEITVFIHHHRCALPILPEHYCRFRIRIAFENQGSGREIGRASCRERV